MENINKSFIYIIYNMDLKNFREKLFIFIQLIFNPFSSLICLFSLYLYPHLSISIQYLALYIDFHPISSFIYLIPFSL